jgi:hypothetical protein
MFVSVRVCVRVCVCVCVCVYVIRHSTSYNAPVRVWSHVCRCCVSMLLVWVFVYVRDKRLGMCIGVGKKEEN